MHYVRSGHVEGLALLHARRAALDAAPTAADRLPAIDQDITRFIRVIAATVPVGEVQALESPAAADETMSGSALLDRLRARAGDVVDGPLGREQYWVSTARPPHLPPRAERLEEAYFTHAAAAQDHSPATKPHLGLYTSSPVLGAPGMWWCFLQLHDGSTLFPRPWRVWAVRRTTDAAVVEIATAADWVNLVAAYPRPIGQLLFPDWHALAAESSAVHMTLAAIAATQGLAFRAGRRLVAAPYWDVESTLWLRWDAESVALVSSSGEWPSAEDGHLAESWITEDEPVPVNLAVTSRA